MAEEVCRTFAGGTDLGETVYRLAGWVVLGFERLTSCRNYLGALRFGETFLASTVSM